MTAEPTGDAKVIPLRRDDAASFDTHFEIDLDDEEPDLGSPVYVDQPERTAVIRPIIPSSLRGKGAIRATVKRKTGRAARRAGYHAVRVLPLYLPMCAFWAVVGAGRFVDRQCRWWWVIEQSQLRQSAATRDDWEAWDRLHREAKATRLWRGIALLGEMVALTAATVVVVVLAPWWAQALLTLAVLLWLAHTGHPPDRPIVRPAVVAPRWRKLNSDVVLRAYYVAGLGHPDKPGQQVDFGGPMARDPMQTGSQVVIDLPHGKTFADAVKAKAAIASGLDVTEQQVFLTRDKTSTRRHLLFVADRDPLAVPVGRTDLLDCKPRSIWRPMRVGKDERDRLVTMLLMWQSILIGAQPRKGKTFSARLIALFAALDPFVKLIIADGKRSPDWDKFRFVAHRMIVGTHPNPRDNDPIYHLFEALDEILRHIDRVNDVLSQLPVDLCPEGVLTEQLARDLRFPDLRVWVLVMEEFQLYFETEDQDVNKEVAAKLSRIQATGPSAGVIVVSSSQKPAGVGAGDVGRLFNRYRDNHPVRFALKCGNRQVSEAVLGGDAYSEGFDASSLPAGREYRGVGYLYGLTDETPAVRTFLADHPDAERILLAARRHREVAGTLSGMAAGEDVARQVRDVLADVRSVFYAGEAWLSWQQLAVRLSERIPEHYADLNPEAISAQVRAFGVPSVNGKQDGQVLKGAKVDMVEQAMRQREAASS